MVMWGFSFSEKFCEWASVLLQSARISILLNGSAKGYFSCEQGIRQRDLLSYIMFCLREDYLSRLLSDLRFKGDLMAKECGSRGFSPYAFFFMQMTSLFVGRASKHNLKVVVDAFRDYGRISGHQVSWKNSYIFFYPRTFSAKCYLPAYYYGIQLGHFPLMYLGAPLFKCSLRHSHLQGVTDSILSKIDKW